MGLGIDLEFRLIASFHERRLSSKDRLPTSHFMRLLATVLIGGISKFIDKLLRGSNEGLTRFLPFEKFGHGRLASLGFTVADIRNRIFLARGDVFIGFNSVLDSIEGIRGKRIVRITK